MKLYGRQLNNGGDHVRSGSSMNPGYMSEGVYDDSRADYSIDPLGVIRRRLFLIALVMFVASGLATGLTLLQTPLYTASAKILIQPKNSTATAGTTADITGLQNLTGTMAELVHTRPIAEGVIKKLNLSTGAYTLLSNLTAQQVNTTQIIEVSYTDSSPKDAERVVNAVGDQFSEQVSKKGLGSNTVTALVQERATLPTSPVSPNPIRNTLLGLVAGLMLGVGLAFLLEHRDDKWGSPEEVSQVSGVPTVGIIPAVKVHKTKLKGSA